MKSCTKCKIVKALCEFSRNGPRLRAHCKSCISEYKARNRDAIRAKQREWVARNAEKVSAHKKAYNAANAESIRARRAAYNAKNKDSIAAYKKQYNAENKGSIREYASRRYRENREYYSAHNKEWIARNKEYRDSYSKQYREENREAKSKAERRRISSKLKATPVWADLQAIKEIYDLADEIGGVHVDHIVPLRSKIVCGLHVHWNLQILSPQENMAKGNWWWPDMPD